MQGILGYPSSNSATEKTLLLCWTVISLSGTSNGHSSTTELSTSPSSDNDLEDYQVALIFATVIIVLLLGIIGGLILVMVYWKRKHREGRGRCDTYCTMNGSDLKEPLLIAPEATPIPPDFVDFSQSVSPYLTVPEKEIYAQRETSANGSTRSPMESNADLCDHYETQSQLELDLERFSQETMYQRPADAEDDLFLQLDRQLVTTIPQEDIDFCASIQLGSGQFARVKRATWRKENGETIDVAVKMMNSDAEFEKIRFLQEAVMMGQFSHPNVLQILGVIKDEHVDSLLMLVTELMTKGDLHTHLKSLKSKHTEDISRNTQHLLLSFCRQICSGMVYLSSIGFVHRDLAARNILLSEDNVCKISDFGMSRDLEDESYYLAHKNTLIPVKWTAPEAFNYRKYSTASDVWSFGCLLYEIWSIGKIPFKRYDNDETMKRVESGYRLPPPPGCPKIVYELMIHCWHPYPNGRPVFHDVRLVLLQHDETLLGVPVEALASHPQAGQLGAPLEAGHYMYPSLQHIYLKSR